MFPVEHTSFPQVFPQPVEKILAKGGETLATKVKNSELTSVDFVKSGANQDAHICLFKSNDEPEESFMKGIWDRFKAFMGGAISEEEFQKSSIAKAKQQIKDENQLYTSILKESMDSIILNDQLDPIEKYELMQKSMNEFTSTMDEVIKDWHNTDISINNITKSLYGDVLEEGESEMAKIDKSRLTPEEQEQLEALMKKAEVEKDDPDEPENKFPPKKNPPANEPKEDEGDDEVKKAFQAEMEAMRKNMEALQKSNDMKEMHTIAKKYTLLGKKEDELAETLYKMKNYGEETFNEYISALDQNLALVEKSGLFTEIGKSGNAGAYVGTDAESKIEKAATELRKSNPDMSYFDSIEKAWEEHPELAAEYERSYMERR